MKNILTFFLLVGSVVAFGFDGLVKTTRNAHTATVQSAALHFVYSGEDSHLPASFDISADFPIVDPFDVNQVTDFITFLSRIDEILGSSAMGSLTFGQYVDWLNLNGTKTALTQLGQTGFF